MKKEVKKPTREVKENSFYFTVYNLISLNYSPSQISKKLNISKQQLNHYISKLKALNLISKVSYGIWEIKKEVKEKELILMLKQRSKGVFSLGTSERPKTNLHALQINFPILSGKINDKDWEVKEKLKNWIPKYTKLQELGGLRVKNNNNKSLTVWAEQREVKNIDEVHNLEHQIRYYIFNYFKNKYNVVLDYLNVETKNLDMATEDKNAESMRGKGEKFVLNLNKIAQKVFPNDKMPAKAWIDGTPYNFSAETNDLDWKREYLNMPFNIKHLIYSMPALEEYNKNLKLHIAVQQEQLKTNREIQASIKELTEVLKQK
jgi:hypothetical protein